MMPWIEFWGLFWIGTVSISVVLSVYLSRSRFVVQRFINPVYKEVRCEYCTLGAQYLSEGTGWGPIPHGVRMVVRGRLHMTAPQANIRRCGHCGGTGYTAKLSKGSKDFGLQEEIS